MGRNITNDAVTIAGNAHKRVWSRLSGAERRTHLFKLWHLIQENAQQLALAESRSTGKPFSEASGYDIPLAAAWFFYYAGWADKLDYAGLSPSSSYGVVGCATSEHSPLLSFACTVAPALAVGNTVVAHSPGTGSSTLTTVSTVLFAELLQHTDFPAGVVNIVSGGEDAATALFNHPEVNTVEGHPDTASVHIVCDDAPFDEAIEGIIADAFMKRGLLECVNTLVFVQENVHDDVVNRLKNRAQFLRWGDPLDPNCEVGPLHNDEQFARAQEFVSAADAEGVERWQVVEKESSSTVNQFRPTIFTRVPGNSRLVREKICAPLLSVLTFRTLQEAITDVNALPHTFSATVWSEKGSRVFALADALRTTSVRVNTLHSWDPVSCFGQSPDGRGNNRGNNRLSLFVKNGASQ